MSLVRRLESSRSEGFEAWNEAFGRFPGADDRGEVRVGKDFNGLSRPRRVPIPVGSAYRNAWRNSQRVLRATDSVNQSHALRLKTNHRIFCPRKTVFGLLPAATTKPDTLGSQSESREDPTAPPGQVKTHHPTKSEPFQESTISTDFIRRLKIFLVTRLLTLWRFRKREKIF